MTTFVWRWLWMIGVLAGVCVGVDHLHRLQAPYRIAHAQYFPSDQPVPPSGSLAGESVDLPHDRRIRELRSEPFGWYRLRFDYTPTGTSWAVYIESSSMNAAVLVNGTPVGSGGSITGRVSRNLFRPLLLEIPERLLQQGPNEAVIVVRGVSPRPAFLGAVSIGPMAELEPFYTERHFVKVDFMHLLVVFLLALSVPTAVLWLYRRQESACFWEAVSAVLFAIYTANFALPDLPLPSIARDLLSHATIAAFIITTTVLIHRFQGLQAPRLERAFALTFGVGIVVLAALSQLAPDIFAVAAPAWDAAALMLGGYPGWVMLRAHWRLPEAAAFWLMLSGIALLLLGTHDLLVVSRIIPPFDGYYVFYVAPMPVLAFTWILLERFRSALTESESLNRDLASRVQEKTAQLERAYLDRQQLEQAQAITVERERILRDMHDGVGGRLVSTLARLEGSGQAQTAVADTVRESLADLRLIIYSLEPSAQDLRAALALMRDRLGAACSDAGLQVEWNLQDLPDACVLGPRETLQVMRVVQEAITNVLKHAHARRIQVRAASAERAGRAGIAVSIADDGAGMAVNGSVPGTGLGSMRRRAAMLKGELNIEPLASGTRVELWVPQPETPPARIA